MDLVKEDRSILCCFLNVIWFQLFSVEVLSRSASLRAVWGPSCLNKTTLECFFWKGVTHVLLIGGRE